MFPELMRDDVFRLETARLWLRWPRASDAQRISEFAGDRDVALMTANIPNPYPSGAAAAFILASRAKNFTGEHMLLAITPKHRPNELIGCIGLRPGGVREATLGYWLGKPHWRQGLMGEAVTGFVDIAMRSTKVVAIKANIRPANGASRKLLEKAAFSSTGSGVEPAPARGGSLPVERFSLTREAWSGIAGANFNDSLARAN